MDLIFTLILVTHSLEFAQLRKDNKLENALVLEPVCLTASRRALEYSFSKICSGIVFETGTVFDFATNL